MILCQTFSYFIFIFNYFLYYGCMEMVEMKRDVVTAENLNCKFKKEVVAVGHMLWLAASIVKRIHIEG